MALGPGGKEVGRVSVRVVPETSKFRKDLKKKLKKIKQEFRVKVVADTKGLRKSIQDAVDGASATVDVDADTRKARERVKQVGEQIRNTDFSFDIDLPMNRFERVIGNAVANATRLRAALVSGTRSVVDMTRRAVNIKAHFQNAALAALRLGETVRSIRFNSIANGVRRIGTGFVNVGRTGRSALGGIGKMLSGALSGVTGMLSGIGSGISKAVSGFSQLGHGAKIFVLVLSVIAPLIGLIGALIGGLPSLLFAVGAPIAAIAMGLDGIKAAAQSIAPQFNAMKAAISSAFQQGLTPVFKQLATVFPTLQRGMLTVTGGLVFLAQQFTNVVTSAQGMFQIEAILANVGSFLQSLGPFITGFTSGLLTLAQVGSEAFGSLAMVLNNFGTSWNEMASRVANSGALTTALQGLGQVTDALLQGFLRLTEVGINLMGSMAGPLTTFINGFTNLMVGLMPIMAAVSNLLFNVLGAAFSALGPVLAALAPSITLLGEMLGTLLVGAINALVPILMPLAQIINDVLLMALRAIQPVLPPIIDALTMLGNAVGAALLAVFQALAPVLQTVMTAFGQLLAAVAPLLPLLAQLAGAVLMALVQAVTPLIPPLLELVQAILPPFIAIVQALMPVLLLLVNAFIQLLPPIIGFVGAIAQSAIPIIQALADIVNAVMPHIVGIIRGAMTMIEGIINVIMGVITGDWSRAWEGVKQILKGAWELIKSAVQAGIQLVLSLMRSLPGALLSALGNVGSLLFGAGKAIIQGLWDGLKALWESVKGWVSGIADWISANKGPISKDRRLLIPAGRAIMHGLQKGLEQNWQGVQRSVLRMAPQLQRAFAGVDLASAITDGTPAAVASVNRMVSAANKSANFQWHGEVESDGFGSVADRVAEALAGWGIQLDSNGLMKLVNKANTRKARRR